MFWLEEVLKHPITHPTKEWYKLFPPPPPPPPSTVVRGLRNYHRDPFLGRLSYTKSGSWRYHSDAYETCYPWNHRTYYSVSLGPEKKGVVFINRVQQPNIRSVQLLYWLSPCNEVFTDKFSFRIILEYFFPRKWKHRPYVCASIVR